LVAFLKLENVLSLFLFEQAEKKIKAAGGAVLLTA